MIRVVMMLLALSPLGCAPLVLIPGTKVADTKQNRELIDVCEKYRRALEERDGPALLALAHPKYFAEAVGPEGATDYTRLQDVLAKRLPTVRSLRYNIQYRHIEIDGPKARVDIRYDVSFLIATAMGDRWERKQNDKRLELESDNGHWLILAGM